jgi:hypothetical protein
MIPNPPARLIYIRTYITIHNNKNTGSKKVRNIGWMDTCSNDRGRIKERKTKRKLMTVFSTRPILLKVKTTVPRPFATSVCLCSKL